MATIPIIDGEGNPATIQAPNANGRTGADDSSPVVLSAEDKAALDALVTAISDLQAGGDASADGQAAIIAAIGNQEYTLSEQPVTGPLTDNELRAAPIETDIVGAVAITADALPLPSGAATADKQDANTAAVNKLGSAKNFFPITPDGNADLAIRPDAVYCGSAGDVVLKGTDGTNATFAVLAGQVLPVSPTRVLAAGTTATGLVGLVS